ncbi:hypothetical protein JCM14076_04470 [Methylosoma difficile]
MLNALHKLYTALLLGGVLILLAPGAQAARVDYTFSGALDSGELNGTSYTGSFSYFDGNLNNSGLESRQLSAFSFSFLANTYDLNAADFKPSAEFLDGLFLGINFTSSFTDPALAFISSAGTGLPDDVAYLAYAPAFGDAGFGSFTIDSVNTVNAVPVPAALWLFAPALSGLLLSARRKAA